MSAKQMKDCNLYVYVSSIHPWTHRKLLNRPYCLMRTKRITYGNIAIAPFKNYSNDPRARGVFVYRKSGKSRDTRRFFYDSVRELTRFLNYLTYYCRHGFVEMDNYIYGENALDDNEIFDQHKLPSVPGQAIAHTYTKTSILRYLKESMKNVDNFSTSNPLIFRIENALLLYRNSFFQLNEGIRYVLQFTALESLVGTAKSAFGDKLIKNIVHAVRNVCRAGKLQPTQINKICSHIGQLKQESINSMIKSTLRKHNITSGGKEINVYALCKARNKFVHEGVEVDRLHRLSLVLEKIIPALVSKLLETI